MALLVLLGEPDGDLSTALAADQSGWLGRPVAVSHAGQVFIQRPERHGRPALIDMFRVTKTARYIAVLALFGLRAVFLRATQQLGPQLRVHPVIILLAAAGGKCRSPAIRSSEGRFTQRVSLPLSPGEPLLLLPRGVGYFTRPG
jgi:hypothetical protein